MTINIHIEAHPDRGPMRAQIDDAMEALGFQREAKAVASSKSPEVAVAYVEPDTYVPSTGDKPGEIAAAIRAAETEVSDDKRPVGKASGDRARRTKAEMAEDAALEAMAEKTGVAIDKLNDVIGQVGRAKAEEGLKARAAAPAEDVKQAISTGESRVGPEDTPETEAQDAADEAAEVDAKRDAEKPLTADDLKQAMGLYVQKFGLAETQEDGPNLFNDALGEPPAGEQFWKVTLVATQGQAVLSKAIEAWKTAAAAGKRYVAKGA